jgi:Ca-activated chloride channel family protein
VGPRDHADRAPGHDGGAMRFLPADFRFAEPWFLLLLLVLPLVWLWNARPRRREATVLYADAASWMPGPTLRTYVEAAMRALPFLAYAFAVVALARPQSGTREVDVRSEGIDIVMAIDASGSMKAEDFKPNNRLFVARDVATKFVDGRKGDRIGIVVFAGEAFTQCPLTLDYGVLKDLIQAIDFGIEPDGTAIGMAIAQSVNRLRKSEAKSKVVILLTDGINNSGAIDPQTAAEAAAALGIKIYTIGVGVEGEAPYPVDDPVFGRRYVRMPSEVDDEALAAIAKRTGGLYFRATSPEALARIYDRIDKLEKTKVETREYVDYSDMGPQLAVWAAAFLAMSLIAGVTVVSRLP